jgi:hypothetical protein
VTGCGLKREEGDFEKGVDERRAPVAARSSGEVKRRWLGSWGGEGCVSGQSVVRLAGCCWLLHLFAGY